MSAASGDPGSLALGWWLEFAAGEPADVARGHVFAGSPAHGSAACVNCARPLLQYAALDAHDPRFALALGLRARLPLLFCWTCNVAQDELHYRVEPDGVVQLLACGPGGVETDFPYALYPRAFPAGVATLAPISAAERAVLDAVGRGELEGWRLAAEHPALAVPRHQVGGRPLHPGPLPARRCAACGRAMPFLAAFGDACLDPRGFTGNPFARVLFHLCAPCRTVCAWQFCD